MNHGDPALLMLSINSLYFEFSYANESSGVWPKNTDSTCGVCNFTQQNGGRTKKHEDFTGFQQQKLQISPRPKRNFCPPKGPIWSHPLTSVSRSHRWEVPHHRSGRGWKTKGEWNRTKTACFTDELSKHHKTIFDTTNQRFAYFSILEYCNLRLSEGLGIPYRACQGPKNWSAV